MYVIANVIYGVPLTQELCDNLPVDYDDLESYGFTLLYSGNSDHQVGFLGVNLGTFDESSDAIAIKKKEELVIEGKDGTEVKLHPTTKDISEVKKMMDALPDDLKETLKTYGKEVGVYIIWSTS